MVNKAFSDCRQRPAPDLPRRTSDQRWSPYGYGYQHGTSSQESIGAFVSYGCIRMLNQDISDLFERMDVGTQVVVTRWSQASGEADLGSGPNCSTTQPQRSRQPGLAGRHRRRVPV